MSSNCTFGTTFYKTRKNNPNAYNSIIQKPYHSFDFTPTETVEFERPSSIKVPQTVHTKETAKPKAKATAKATAKAKAKAKVESQNNISKSCDTLRDIVILGSNKTIEKEGKNMCKEFKLNEKTCVNELKALSKKYITQNYTEMIDNKTCTFKTLQPINPFDFVDAEAKKTKNNATLKKLQTAMNTQPASQRKRNKALFDNIVGIGCTQFMLQSSQMEASGKAMGIEEEDRKVMFGLLNPGFEPLYSSAKAQCKKNESKKLKQ